MRMETPKHILGAIVLAFLFKGAVSQGAVSQEILQMKLTETGGKVTLDCGGKEVIWRKDGEEISNQAMLHLGSEQDDPRGLYECDNQKGSKDQLQVYFRMCQSCIEFNVGTISGLLIADVIATALIAFAVYCVTSPDKGQSSRASDKQTLIRNEQLYQPLGDRENSEYSHLSTARPRK